jgi:hypothetical protein
MPAVNSSVRRYRRGAATDTGAKGGLEGGDQGSSGLLLAEVVRHHRRGPHLSDGVCHALAGEAGEDVTGQVRRDDDVDAVRPRWRAVRPLAMVDRIDLQCCGRIGLPRTGEPMRSQH